MVCLIDVKEQTVTVLMWLFTMILAIGIILAFIRCYGKHKTKGAIDEKIPLYMTAVGLVGATLIGMLSNNKREGFKALYGV